MCKTGNDRRLILTKPYFITCLFVPLLALFNMDLVSEPKKVGSCFSTGLYQTSNCLILQNLLVFGCLKCHGELEKILQYDNCCYPGFEKRVHFFRTRHNLARIYLSIVPYPLNYLHRTPG